ncbi:hypothetical protein TRFO_17897 [Tritrichomonas foetus]|uniref:Cyclic nucleotide-binding domain-containing protein n=1 Tax=Tritrichomonas foetus TaxID=1144522 RepID=A0A1J4KR87_9EUKA|nr:hypothetical protein TRFO_17897 [Tritrichomonas foetus]|eukprot:OHT12316.1 hypothetical protein TRFO_17897 [Tritrichomonas foetus]
MRNTRKILRRENLSEEKRPNSSRRQKKRIVMKPRKQIPISERRYTQDTAFEALKLPPSKRKSWQVDSIISIFSQWPEFEIITKNARELYQISRNCEIEHLNENTFLFAEGDLFDAFYLIFSGEVMLVREKFRYEDFMLIKTPKGPKNNVRQYHNVNPIFRDQSITAPNSPNTPIFKYPIQKCPTFDKSLKLNQFSKNLLEYRFGSDKKFEAFDLKAPHSIIGFSELEKQKPWSYSAVVTQPSYIIRIDATVYQKTIAMIREEEKINRARYLAQIPVFEELQDIPELFNRLADNVIEMKIPKGTKRKSFCDGWIVVQSGSVSKHRKVNFNLSSIDPRALSGGAIDIRLPKGETYVKLEVLGPDSIIADPSLTSNFKKPYKLEFMEDTVIYCISMNDLRDLLPISFRRNLEKQLLDDPSDDYLIRKWIEREMVVKWQMYKKSISKESKNYAEYEKIMKTGFASCRRMFPKMIKDHQVTCQNPRFKAIHQLDKSLKTGEIEIPSTFTKDFK